jgi:hypothetical protein
MALSACQFHGLMVQAMTSPVRHRPILFSAPMVRALLEGRKTQTRRPIYSVTKNFNAAKICRQYPPIIELTTLASGMEVPKYLSTKETYSLNKWFDVAPGDLLWVRETWREGPDSLPESIFFFADEPWHKGAGWRPSIHMPRRFSRLTLRVTAVRVQRLQDISEEDARAEGIDPLFSKQEIASAPSLNKYAGKWSNYLWHGHAQRGTISHKQASAWRHQFSNYNLPSESFSSLWESIHGPGSWEANPWVAAITFDVIRANVDAVANQPICEAV